MLLDTPGKVVKPTVSEIKADSCLVSWSTLNTDSIEEQGFLG